MLRPLTEKQIDKLLDEATEAFGEKGYAGAKLNAIAKKAGVSVGVIYKYYEDKKALFTACVERSLGYLEEVFSKVARSGGSLFDMVSVLITSAQEAARIHPEYFRLYHQITLESNRLEVGNIAELIEGKTAELYTTVLENAKKEGLVRQDMDPALFAFFFDNLMMMLHFAYTSKYYEDRLRIYKESALEDDESVRRELMKFLTGALGASEE